MKVIFLDIDGVLINEVCFLNRDSTKKEPQKPDPNCVAALNEIVKSSGANIVVSSSWRLNRTLEQLRTVLRGWGVDAEIIGKTPYIAFGTRGQEISEWLKIHSEVEKFIIIDDDDEMGVLSNKLLLTDFISGLHTGQIKKALKLFDI